MRLFFAMCVLGLLGCDELCQQAHTYQMVCRARESGTSGVEADVSADVEVLYSVPGFEGRPVERLSVSYKDGGVVYCDRVRQ